MVEMFKKRVLEFSAWDVLDRAETVQGMGEPRAPGRREEFGNGQI